ncbi:MAG: hypothetical protein PHY51_04610 [Candidatus Gracilibacteria bacterium]|nr:hypothetical protein [Candidatus Gracilibacteria bacterium]
MTLMNKIKVVMTTDLLTLGKKPQLVKKDETIKKTEEVSEVVADIINNNGYSEKQLNTYFNPITSDIADINALAKIIQGYIINPSKLKDFNSKSDCIFFVACNSGVSEDIPMMFDEKTRDILYKCSWFGLFATNSSSQIVIPNKYIINISADKQTVEVNIFDKNVWELGGGLFQVEKNIRKKIIQSNVDNNFLNKIIKTLYGDVMFL